MNPLIVHVGSTSDVLEIAANIPEKASFLLEAFSPGPLSIVLPKKDCVPSITTADKDTVAVRIPSHPIAQKLIELSGCPIAAPSANTSNSVSPTKAEHVLRTLDGKIDAVIDGGSSDAGLESTVVDCSGSSIRLLRPGPISLPEIEKVVGKVEVPSSVGMSHQELLSPGMMQKHYSPNADVHILSIDELLNRELNENVGCLLHSDADTRNAELICLPLDSKRYASQLFAVLHTFDERGVDVIYVEELPDTEEWRAVRDRLQRAAAT